MPIPDFQSLMLPLLQYASDGREHSLRESIDKLAEQFHLTREERNELLPSGLQAIFDNRVGWARTYLKKAGLLQPTRRGYFKITERGQQVLQQNPPKINIAFLKQFPEFLASQKPVRGEPEGKDEPEPAENAEQKTPEEVIEAAYQRLRQDLAADLIQAVKERSPVFFERLVIDLLVKMGYGGTRKDAGEAIGRSGDEGIDGIIKEDRLGLDVVYVQAKRWDNVVGSPELQRFAGALAGQRASKGVFITTSSFSQAARDFVSHLGSKIVLIDGEMLAQLMIDYSIGVASGASYELKRADSDYFTEE
jgi:restriction system protein